MTQLVFLRTSSNHKLGEVNNECKSHNFIVLAICVPKIIKFGGGLTKFWQKQVGSFLAHPVYERSVVLYTVRHKNTPNFFYHNLKKGYPILIIFGTHIHDTTGHHMAVQFPTSSNICFCTTW